MVLKKKTKNLIKAALTAVAWGTMLLLERTGATGTPQIVVMVGSIVAFLMVEILDIPWIPPWKEDED